MPISTIQRSFKYLEVLDLALVKILTGSFFNGEMLEERKSDWNYSYDIQLGANYYLTENLGLSGALGVKTSLFRIGLLYKY